eukprot:9487013-Pyramimonas_sp.AAC.1
MRETWEAQWCPNDPEAAREHLQNWKHHAAQVIDKATCSAGFDGWEAKELKIRKKSFPEIIKELHQ